MAAESCVEHWATRVARKTGWPHPAHVWDSFPESSLADIGLCGAARIRAPVAYDGGSCPVFLRRITLTRRTRRRWVRERLRAESWSGSCGVPRFRKIRATTPEADQRRKQLETFGTLRKSTGDSKDAEAHVSDQVHKFANNAARRYRRPRRRSRGPMSQLGVGTLGP